MKSAPILAHNAISGTATSEEIQLGDSNSALVHVVITGVGTWKIDIYGAEKSGGTFVPIYDSNDYLLTTGEITTSREKLFIGLNDYIKIVATEVVNGASCTVNVIPMF